MHVSYYNVYVYCITLSFAVKQGYSDSIKDNK